MGRIIEFLLRRKVMIYLLTVFILVAGTAAVLTFKRELLPQANFPMIVVSISGDSLPAEEIEDKVTKPIEKEIKSLSNIEDFSSTTQSGSMSIQIKASEGKGNDVKQDVQNIVNRLRNSFPKEMKNVNVIQQSFGGDQLMGIALSGKDLPTLYNLAATSIKDRLEAIDGVKEVNISEANIQKKIEINFNPETLAAFKITPQQVVNQLQTVNWKQSVGTLSNDSFDTVIEVDNTYKNIHDIQQTLIKTSLGSVPLAEISTIKDLRGTSDQAEFFFNGHDFVDITVLKADGADIVKSADKVQAELNRINQEANGQYHVSTYFEGSSFIKNSISNLSRDVSIGGILAVLVLLLFLRNWRVTLVISTTLPLSVMMTFIAMKIGGYNIDLISLISLSLSMGLIVDAAIVVLESIYQFREQGEDLKSAIKHGVSEVLTPVLTSQLTIIIVFLPLSLSNIGGTVFVPIMTTITFTVSAAIISSTITALLFVPVFSNQFLRKDKQVQHTEQSSVQPSKIVSWFVGVLAFALHNRWKTMGIAVVLFATAIMLASHVKMGSIQNVNENFVYGQIKMPKGTTFTETKLAGLAAEANFRRVPEVKEVFVISNQLDVSFYINLWSKSERKVKRPKDTMMNEINHALNAVKGTDQVSVGFGEKENAPIQLEVKGKDFDTMRVLADQVVASLKTIPGVKNPRSEFSDGEDKLSLLPKHDVLRTFGMDERSLAEQLNAWINPQEITKLSVDDIEYTVTARYPKDVMNHPETFKRILVTIPSGTNVPLSDLVDYKYTKSLKQINHKKGDRVASIQAELIGTDIGSANREVQKLITNISTPNGYKIELAGDLKQQNDNLINGLLVFLGALALIYIIMVGQFNRLSHPLLILLTLPMAVVGVVVGLVSTGRELNELGMVGVIMLIGIVVSNAILLIDRINVLRERDGLGLHEAIIEGTKNRVRPVLMTKLTAILGMLPLGLVLSEGSSFEAPLATVVIFGLIFHTLITLLLVPVLYSLFEGFREWQKNRKQQKRIGKYDKQGTQDVAPLAD